MMRSGPNQRCVYITLAIVVLLTARTGFAQTPACLTGASDPDGDRWGFEFGQGCHVINGLTVGASGQPVCSATAVDHGSGWGYEHGAACVWALGTGLAPTGLASAGAAESSGNSTDQSVAMPPTVIPHSERPGCVAGAIDNGDGWGWQNDAPCIWPGAVGSTGQQSGQQSTEVATSQVIPHDQRPSCSTAAADNGDGWGFENGASCIFRDHETSSPTPSTPTSSRPQCSASAVDNGDGWGWEKNAACIWAEGGPEPVGSATRPVCSASAISNGDGWGWENDDSCRFPEATASHSVASPANDAAQNDDPDPPPQTQPDYDADGNRICSAYAFDSGGGWGYEYGESCRWGSVQPASGEVEANGAAPPPVGAASIGFIDGKPICLTDASDGNGDGYGYEDNRTCRNVNGVTATSQNPLLDTRWCQPWAEISYGDYVLQNNTWNDSEVYSNNWAQCIELGRSGGNYIAKWDYNWLGRYEGNEFSVKSYPQVYYGRKTRNSISGPRSRLGLPANINNLPSFKVRYRYSETGNAERNVAFESFFHTSCEAEEWNKHFELMVWVDRPVSKTPGRIETEATIDGKEWLVYSNPSLSWGYVAFVEKTPSRQGTLDWNAFVDWTRYEGPRHGIWSIGDNTCMGAIEIGTETFWGSGTFTLDEFQVIRQ